MQDKKIPYKIYLDESEIPTQWYNVRADMKNKPAPILNPATMKTVTVEELAPIFCTELAKQELDETTPYFDIPQEIRDFYRMYRPSPLVRAYCLEKKLAEHKAAVNELSGICAQVPNSLTAPDTSIFDLGLSVRATNCLWRAGYDTLGKVTDAAEVGQLKAVRNLGMKSLEEILTVLYTITGKNYRRLCV